MKPTTWFGLAGLSLATAAAVFAHPGGLDSQGGHYDRRTGLYHLHRGGTGATGSDLNQPRNLQPREEAPATPPASALEEMQKKLDAQSAEIAALHARVAALEAKLAAVEATPAATTSSPTASSSAASATPAPK